MNTSSSAAAAVPIKTTTTTATTTITTSSAPTLKRCTSYYQGLDKRMKQECTLLPSAPPASPATSTMTIDDNDDDELKDSPSHFELEPPALPLTPIKQEPMVYNNNDYGTIHQFYEGVKRYNGYQCKFLKKPLKFQMFSSAMSLTCHSGVAVFSLPRLMRARLIKRVDELFDCVTQSPYDLKKNPFTRSPVFLGIGPHARLFRQPTPGAAAVAFGHEELRQGMYFHGRLSLDVLGVKSNSNNTELSLMLRVKELYFMADQLARSIDGDDENLGVCTLEEPLEGEEDTEDDGTTY
jgi:hypothetical protein